MSGIEIVLNKYKEEKLNKEETINLIEDLYKSQYWNYIPTTSPNITNPYPWQDIIYKVTCTQ